MGKDYSQKSILIAANTARFIAHFEFSDIQILQSLGFRVHCATNFAREKDVPHLAEMLAKQGVATHQIDIERSPYKAQNLKAYRQLRAIIRENDIKAVHCHTPMGGVLARLAASAEGVQAILYTCHGFHFDERHKDVASRAYKLVERKLAKKTDCIITINEEDFRAASCFEKRHDYAFKIPSVGLDISKLNEQRKESIRCRLDIPSDAFVVLVAGDLIERKDPITALKSFYEASIPSSHLVFCGTGPLLKTLEDASRKLLLDGSVHFEGYCPAMANYYREADVLLFPTTREGFGMVGVEAMSFGLPVVVSNIRGITEYVEDGKTGFLCEPKDIQGFAAGLKKIYQEKSNLEPMKRRCVATSKKFHLTNARKAMAEIYSEVLLLDLLKDHAISGFDSKQ